ncbi:CLOCK-interacting pacemaker-like [Lissotriton helveticus]
MVPEAPLQRVVPQPSSEGIEAPSTLSGMKNVSSKDDSEGITKMPDERKNERPRQTFVYSEKDSGFSDAGSDDLSKVEQTGIEYGSFNRSDKPDQLARSDKPPRGTSSTFTSLAPVYILKNVIVQEPVKGAQFLQTQMEWNGCRAMDTTAGQTRVILIQPHITASVSNLWPEKKKSAKRAYFPIVRALPQIAPHPSKDVKWQSSVSVAPIGKMTRPCKRVCMFTSKEELTKRSETVLISKQHKSQGRIVERSPSPNTTSHNLLMPSARRTDMGLQPQSIAPSTVTTSVVPSLLHARQDNLTMCSSSYSISEAETISKVSRRLAANLKKQQRFHNTVDVLKKSGLLDITLMTKELIGRNKATQRNISELKEHTLLFCEAMKSNDCKLWEKLQNAMNLSSFYWNVSGSNAIKLDCAAPTDHLPKGSTDL